MLKRFIAVLTLCVLALGVFAVPAQAATADMKKAKVTWNLTVDKAATCYICYGGLDEQIPIKFKITDYMQHELNDTQLQVRFRVTQTNNFKPTDEQIKTIVNNMVDGSIGGNCGWAIVDYKTGKNLETPNDFGVTVESEEPVYDREQCSTSDGWWVKILRKRVNDVVITFPKDYDGLCIGVLGSREPFATGKDDDYWDGNAAFSETTYWSSDNKKVSHFLRFSYEPDGKKDISKAEISDIKQQTYKAKAIKPKITVTYEGKELVKGTDYSIAYEKNVDAGFAYAVITGMGDYTWVVKKEFIIKPAAIKKVSLEKTKYPYTGEEIKPEVKVTAKVNGETVELTQYHDYLVTYENNIEKGTATLTVRGLANFTGTFTKEFKITKK